MPTRKVKNLDDATYKRLKARAQQQHWSIAQEVTRILTASPSKPPLLSLLESEGRGREPWVGVDAAKVTNDRRLTTLPGMRVVQLDSLR